MAIQVETTQNVNIEYDAADLGLRSIAYVIDIIIIIIWWSCFWVAMDMIGFNFFDGFYAWDSAGMAILIIFLVPVLLYDLLFESLCKGQSPAKMIMGIRVVNLDGTTPSFGSYLIRWLFRLVDFSLSYNIVGTAMVVATNKSQRLGDYLAGTTVINLRSTKRNKTLTLPKLDFNEDYQVTYPDVLDRLTDKDIRTIRITLETEDLRNNQAVINNITLRIKQVTGYYDATATLGFLQKIVDDYTYLSLHQ